MNNTNEVHDVETHVPATDQPSPMPDRDSLSDAVADPSLDAIPDLTALQPKYERLLELADEILVGRATVTIELWEDGEAEIRVYHAHGYPDSDVRHRTVLRYHSETGDVTGAVFETGVADGKTLLHREKIANIGTLGDPPATPAE